MSQPSANVGTLRLLEIPLKYEQKLESLGKRFGRTNVYVSLPESAPLNDLVGGKAMSK